MQHISVTEAVTLLSLNCSTQVVRYHTPAPCVSHSHDY